MAGANKKQLAPLNSPTKGSKSPVKGMNSSTAKGSTNARTQSPQGRTPARSSSPTQSQYGRTNVRSKSPAPAINSSTFFGGDNSVLMSSFGGPSLWYVATSFTLQSAVTLSVCIAGLNPRGELRSRIHVLYVILTAHLVSVLCSGPYPAKRTSSATRPCFFTATLLRSPSLRRLARPPLRIYAETI
jgi:hemin uptake protein HemP